MSTSQALGERPLAEVLAAVAGGAPTPAGGSAAAVTVGLAAGLVAKCARKAVGRVESALDVQARAEELSQQAAELADADADCYVEVVDAVRTTRADPDDVQAQLALEDALERAADPPLAVAEVGVEVAAAAADLAVEGKPWLQGDAHAAALLAESAVQSAVGLVRLNLSDRDGGDRRRERARWLASAAGEARGRAEAALDSRSNR